MSKLQEFLHQCGVVDVESTSPYPETCEIIELAYGFNVDGDWKTISNHYKPSIEIPAESAEKHFITDEMVADAPDFSASYTQHQFDVYIQQFKYFVAHNAPYDRTAIVNNLDKFNIQDEKIADPQNWICTLKLAKKIFSNEMALPAYRLGVLWFYFKLYQGVTRQIIPHQADSDIYMAGRLLECLVKFMIELGYVDDTQDIGPQVVAYLNQRQEVKNWPFGKHKGELIVDVPKSYLQWAVSNMDMFDEKSGGYDPDLAHSVKLAMDAK